jgi:glutamine cyclotransferase
MSWARSPCSRGAESTGLRKVNRVLRNSLLLFLIVAGAALLGSCGTGPQTGPIASSPPVSPTIAATSTPIPSATLTPTYLPTATPIPSATPTRRPTATPTRRPTATPTRRPTATPTRRPTATPTIPRAATSSIPTSPPDLSTSEPVPVYTYHIVHSFPHDRGAFTEGLVYQDGFLYEGTGLWGQSDLRREALATGAILQSRALADQYFGEGVTIFGDRILQLTWKSHTGFIYDKNSFEMLGQFNYPTEGWGLTQDGQHLIMSDGTATLHFLDPVTLEETGQLQVLARGQPVDQLNELEYIRGEVFANVWQTDLIVRIDPETGQVVGWIDLSGLLSPQDLVQPVDVLNGIAYDAGGDRLFVTGKLWPKLFQIELVPKATGRKSGKCLEVRQAAAHPLSSRSSTSILSTVSLSAANVKRALNRSPLRMWGSQKRLSCHISS